MREVYIDKFLTTEVGYLFSSEVCLQLSSKPFSQPSVASSFSISDWSG
jgi:hypothetical protein